MFDMLAVFQKLTATGMSEEAARAQVEALQIAVDEDRLATKADLVQLKNELTIRLSAIVAAIIGLYAAFERLTA